MGELRHKLTSLTNEGRCAFATSLPHFLKLTALTILLASPICGIAIANTTTAVDPERFNVDPLGINITTGMLMRRDPLLVAGDPSAGGLAWRYLPGTVNYFGDVVEVTGFTSGESMVWVTIEGSQTVFVKNSTSYMNGSGQGGSLQKTATEWVFTDGQGAVYRFDISQPRLKSILKPDGTLTTITYDASGYYNVKSVVTNRGFALKYEYSGSVTTIYAINLTAHTCDASLNCDGYDGFISMQITASVDSPSGNADVIADPSGKQWQYAAMETYESPAEAFFPYLQNNLVWYKDPTGYFNKMTFDVAGRATAFFDPRGTFSFAYTGSSASNAAIHPEVPRVLTVKEPGGTKIYGANYLVGGPLYYTSDYLGNITQSYAESTTVGVATSGHAYTSYSRLLSMTYKEGTTTIHKKVLFEYDGNGNITKTTVQPTAGSGLVDITTTAGGYSRKKPLWTKDSKGNQTDYTYDPTHYGTLTVTLPADQNGIRTRTYNTYTTFNTGNGTVYRLTRTETCGLTSAQLALAACPALAATSVTLVDYGTATTAPKTYKTSLPLTVTQSDGASSLAATTTYAYDNMGNVISVDGPLAGNADQSFATYDGNRRKIFEIGPIPGGNGTQKRTLVRHSYDDAGREIQTAQGYANSNLTNGSDAVIISYSQMNYDTAGRLAATIVETTGNVAP